nr:hypothetical protein [Streptomyces coelicoflavus]
MCGLSCLEDQPGRIFFARVLSDHLKLRVELRGTKQREDVIALVRAALSVASGERELVKVVRVFEGESVATGVEHLLMARGTPQLATALPGPLGPRDLRSAQALLEVVEEQLPGTVLHDAVSRELRLDLPLRLAPGDLFSHLVDFNVQPDGLPPAVLLMDLAAELVDTPGWAGALSSWVHGWAEGAGLLTALERRRADRAGAAPDPSVPRCLVVTVEPACDGSEDIVVRPWLNTVPGHWQPRPADPETTSLDGLGPAVGRALRQVVRLSDVPRAATGADGTRTAPPFVEFVLPYELLNHDVAGLAVRPGDGRPLPLGLKYAVHLRSLERMRSDDVLVREQWRERWSTLQSQGIAVHGWQRSDARGQDDWQATLASEPGRTAAVLDAPDGGASTEALKAAIAEGIGLAVWDRRGEFPEERREVVMAVFAAVQNPARLPVVIHQLRQRAELHSAGPFLLGRHIAFLWDDPNRLVDVHTTADYQVGGPASGAGHPGVMDTIDSEETPV